MYGEYGECGDWRSGACSRVSNGCGFDDKWKFDAELARPLSCLLLILLLPELLFFLAVFLGNGDID